MGRRDNSVIEKIRGRRDPQADSLRNIALLSILGVVDFIPISLYQLGVIRHLPEPPGNVFKSDQVNASREAQIAGLPDGTVSMLMYAANVALTGAGLSKRTSPKLVNYSLAAVVIGQASGALYYLYHMIRVQKKICVYCVAGALINFATLLPMKKVLFGVK